MAPAPSEYPSPGCHSVEKHFRVRRLGCPTSHPSRRTLPLPAPCPSEFSKRVVRPLPRVLPSLFFSVGWPRGPTSSIRGPYAPAPTISRLGHAGQQSCCVRRHTFRASQLVHLSPAGAEPLSRTATRRPDNRPVSLPFRAPTFRNRRLFRSVSFEALSGLAVPLPVSPTGPYTPASYIVL